MPGSQKSRARCRTATRSMIQVDATTQRKKTPPRSQVPRPTRIIHGRCGLRRRGRWRGSRPATSKHAHIRLNCASVACFKFQHFALSTSMGLSMSYYQIIRRGKPVAFVTSIAMAHRIVRCRRVGYYAIEKIEIEDGGSVCLCHQTTSKAARRQVSPSNPQPALGGRRPAQRQESGLRRNRANRVDLANAIRIRDTLY